jgi:hypothetical protein
MERLTISMRGFQRRKSRPSKVIRLLESWDRDASAEDRDRALAIMRSSLELTPKPDPDHLLRDAQNILTEARGETDPYRRRELARSALAKARAAMRHHGVGDQQRAQLRQVIGAGRMIVNAGVEAAMRQHSAQPEREHQSPGISL